MTLVDNLQNQLRGVYDVLFCANYISVRIYGKIKQFKQTSEDFLSEVFAGRLNKRI